MTVLLSKQYTRTTRLLVIYHDNFFQIEWFQCMSSYLHVITDGRSWLFSSPSSLKNVQPAEQYLQLVKERYSEESADEKILGSFITEALDKWEEISRSISEKCLITLKYNNFPVCKASLKARIVWSRNLEILDLILIKVPSTLLLVETVKGVFKFLSYLLLHRVFCCFSFPNLTFANQHFNPFLVGLTFAN